MKKVIVALMLVCGVANADPIGQATFKQEAVYGDCKAGYMTWPTGSGWTASYRWAQVVICPGVPTTSMTYKDGKQDVSAVVIQPHLETQAEKAAKAKAAALSKLSLEERKALGL